MHTRRRVGRHTNTVQRITMADADTESADADADEEQEFEASVWASQTPTTRIVGNPVELIYAGRLDDSVKQNNLSFGVVFEDPEVVVGDLFVNEAKPDGDTVENVVDEDSTVPTDYRVADPDDKDAQFDRDGNFKTDEESTVDGELANTYEEADGFDEDEVLVWYNGLTGQRIGRTLDFNGQPFARWTEGDDPYLIKGLLQATDEWREQPQNRKQFAQDGNAPRIARAPILRTQVEYTRNDDGEIQSATLLDEPKDRDVLIDMRRPDEGRGYRAYVFDADAFEDELGSLDASIDDVMDVLTDYEQNFGPEIDLMYSPRADTILDEAGYSMHMYTGAGWPDEPENWTPSNASEVDSFGIAGGDESAIEAEEEQFVSEVAADLAGTGNTPEDAYEGGLDGLVGKYRDQFSEAPDVERIREQVYDRVAHLDTDDLE